MQSFKKYECPTRKHTAKTSRTPQDSFIRGRPRLTLPSATERTFRNAAFTSGGVFVTPSAIIIVGDEQSTETINSIREQLLRRINLLPDTKQPPTIAHSTLMRFVGETSLEEVKRFAGSLDISFTERIDTFQLVRESRLPMLEYTQIETYSFK